MCAVVAEKQKAFRMKKKDPYKRKQHCSLNTLQVFSSKENTCSIKVSTECWQVL